MRIHKERGAAVHFPPPLVFLGFTLLGVAIQAIVPAMRFAVPPWARVAGVVMIVIGVFGIVSARTLFTSTGQSPIPWKPTPELILAGPYRFTRNPMYLSVTCIQVGLGLGVGNVWIALLAPVALLTVHFIAVRPEERYLTERFGQSYREYCRKVRRYL